MTEETKKEDVKEKETEKKEEKTPKKKTEKKEDSEDDNNIYIGGKPFMNYVTGVVTQFTKKGSKEVVIKARGRYISRAVDVAEVSRKKFLEGKDVQVKDIKIGSEEFENKKGKKVNVSIIEITLESK